MRAAPPSTHSISSTHGREQVARSCRQLARIALCMLHRAESLRAAGAIITCTQPSHLLLTGSRTSSTTSCRPPRSASRMQTAGHPPSSSSSNTWSRPSPHSPELLTPSQSQALTVSHVPVWSWSISFVAVCCLRSAMRGGSWGLCGRAYSRAYSGLIVGL